MISLPVQSVQRLYDKDKKQGAIVRALKEYAAELGSNPTQVITTLEVWRVLGKILRVKP
jgi:hypothetical protein